MLLALLRSTARCFIIALREEMDSQSACTGLLVKMDKCMLAAKRKVKLLPMFEERCIYNHLVVREMAGTLYYLAALHLLATARLEDLNTKVNSPYVPHLTRTHLTHTHTSHMHTPHTPHTHAHHTHLTNMHTTHRGRGRERNVVCCVCSSSCS